MEELVDLTLFAESPTDDRHFNLGERRSSERNRLELPWYNLSQQDPSTRSRAYTTTALTPVPKRRPRRKTKFLRSNDLGNSCILARIRRIRSEGEEHIPTNNSIQQRRNVPAMPQLTLSEPQQSINNARLPTPMVWVEDEQMWLISNENPPSVITRDERSPPPSYTPYDYVPEYARSEPSPRNSWMDVSPVRSQFRTLMEPRAIIRDDDRLSPASFQEAVQAVPDIDGPVLPTSTPSLPYEQHHEWSPRNLRTAFRVSSPSYEMKHGSPIPSSRPESLHSAISELELDEHHQALREISEEHSVHTIGEPSAPRKNSVEDITPPTTKPVLNHTRKTSWEGLSRRVARPASALQ